MKYAYFLGCTVPYRESNFDLSTRKVMERVGVELVDLLNVGCCGFPFESVDELKWLALSARIISYGEEKGLDILCLCPGCSSSLIKTNNILRTDEGRKREVNEVLSSIGRKYEGTIQVRHLVQALFEDVGLDAIEALVAQPLNLKVAAHYGCHLLRPSTEIRFEYAQTPESLDLLIEATGVESIDYYEKEQCCGGFLEGISQEVAYSLCSQKVINAYYAGAQALVTVCPFCHVMLDFNQKAVEGLWGRPFNLPVLHYPQLLGLAMGYGLEELGIKQNRVKMDPALLESREGY